MISVVISVGSNCGDRRSNVQKGADWLKSILMQAECSRIYETECAVGKEKPYYNAVLKGFYEGDGIMLDELIKEKEREMGRDAGCRERGDVPIDIDIVIENGGVVKPWDFRQKFFQTGYSEIEH